MKPESNWLTTTHALDPADIAAVREGDRQDLPGMGETLAKGKIDEGMDAGKIFRETAKRALAPILREIPWNKRTVALDPGDVLAIETGKGDMPELGEVVNRREAA